MYMIAVMCEVLCVYLWIKIDIQIKSSYEIYFTPFQTVGTF